MSWDVTPEHVRNSNLIEGFDDPSMDACGLAAFEQLRNLSLPYLTVEDLVTLHRVVVARQPDPRWTHRQNLTGDWRGNFREMDLEVEERKCPPWQEVPLLIRGWLLKMRDWRDLDPREMHVEYEVIHPWADGNGRTGRLLLWWHEVQQGRVPTLIRLDRVQSYYDWFPR